MVSTKRQPQFALLALLLVAVTGACSSTHQPRDENEILVSQKALAGEWESFGEMPHRIGHTATLLPSGKILIAGGLSASYPDDTTSALLFEPATGAWSPAGSMAGIRCRDHTATLLRSGKVVVIGGHCDNRAIPSIEVYDPVTNTWSLAGDSTESRWHHTATLLQSGEVLIAGGFDENGALARTSVFDPVAGILSTVSSIARVRAVHSATLLPSGKVLVAGGSDGWVSFADAELFDPAKRAWSDAGTMTVARASHAAVLLPSGKVLVAGGWNNDAPLAGTEIYDPATNTWTAAGTMLEAHTGQSAVLLPGGAVLVSGGFYQDWTTSSTDYVHSGPELYEPARNAWRRAGFMMSHRQYNTTTLLDDGNVLVIGGEQAPIEDGSTASSANAEIYDSETNVWTVFGSMVQGRGDHTATLLPSGKVFVTGGTAADKAEYYDPETNRWSIASDVWQRHRGHIATLLPSGRVLIAGGDISAQYESTDYTYDAWLFDPAVDGWYNGGYMVTESGWHAAVLLSSGKVLVTGGLTKGYGYYSTDYYSLAGAQVFDPDDNDWRAVSSMARDRYLHTLTRLQSGVVLAIGGVHFDTRNQTHETLISAELYEPEQETWRNASSLSQPRAGHTSTLLQSGKVLVVGGFYRRGDNTIANTASAELYDPLTDSWSTAHSLAQPRAYHTATLLPSGMVLVVGGSNDSTDANSGLTDVELYNPSSNTWSSAKPLERGRASHTATLLASGKVLIAGGTDGGAGASFALYDSATPSCESLAAGTPCGVCRACDGAGACKPAPSEASCGICAACDGAGNCSVVPESDAACGIIDCDALDTPCRDFADLVAGQLCRAGCVQDRQRQRRML
ncbi:MAG: kelch repeat-containing protein [Pseudomonadota bacterium]